MRNMGSKISNEMSIKVRKCNGNLIHTRSLSRYLSLF